MINTNNQSCCFGDVLSHGRLDDRVGGKAVHELEAMGVEVCCGWHDVKPEDPGNRLSKGVGKVGCDCVYWG